MSTIAPAALNKMYVILDPYLKSLRRGGIVGDTRHVAGGGYHISRDDLRAHGQSGDYSIQAPADHRGPGNAASAIDLSLNPSEMVIVSKRLRAAMEGSRYDPRIEPLREFFGTVNNHDVCGFNRYQTNKTSRPVGWIPSGASESSHLWHVHLSFFRDYCDDLNSIRGVSEVVAGLKPGALGWHNPDGATKVTPPTTLRPSGPTRSKPRPPLKPKAPTGPGGQRVYVMYVTKDGTHSYAKPPAIGKVTHTRRRGFKVVGYPVRRSDGRYLRTLFGNDYPLSRLSHAKPKK